MKPILEVNNIGKKYRIQHLVGGYMSLRERMANAFRSDKSQTEDFWALNDVSFEMNAGESIGIIGRNGAGKSTLLKILSKITPPTKGKIVSRGRIASLLEVGTGFHPELTGRENIFFNGSLLGMKRMEIAAKFDEIVDFSGVEKFLDTPLKHYSSGMQLRLAFAVAAFLEPEILIIDEVLAVGDAEFQKKCLGKMEDVSKSGRTILFVSHNMGALLQLCKRGIFISSGAIVQDGSMNVVADQYLKTDANKAKVIDREVRIGENQFRRISMIDEGGEFSSEFRYDAPISIRSEISLPNFHHDLELALRLIDKFKQPVFTIHEKLIKHYKNEPKIDLLISIPPHFLTPGDYSWTICINHPGTALYDLQEDVVNFSILETGSDFSRYMGLDYGRVFATYEAKAI
jgi:lipopolysaccharide transport system ATP-binding protein